MVAYVSFTFEELDEEDGTPCKCCRFNRGTDLPIPTDLSVEEIQRATKHFSASIFKDWTKLNAILKRYEAVIQKRWMKKGLKQRREILLRAWPGMSSTHRPDFKNLRTLKKHVPRSRTCLAEACLWPYINLEDLQKRNLLLMFLNTRGRNLPDTFRLADVKAAHLGDGWDRGLDFADSLEDYCCPAHYVEDHDEDDTCMLFEQKHSPRKYGRIVTNHAKSLKTRQYKYLRGTHEGLLSLEIHKSTYRFLVECTKLILHDIPPISFFLAPTVPEPFMLGLPGPNDYPSLSAHSLEAAYRVPQMLDLERLKMLVSSRRESAEDHVWLLKEDPSYFITSLREYNEHNGDKASGTCTCWYSVLGKMVNNAYEVFVFWDDIDRRLHNMASIEAQLERANEKNVRLSKQDEDKWAALLEVLWRLMMIPVWMLHDGVPTSPRLRSKYRWFSNDNSSSPAKGSWVISAKSSDSERRLDTLFYSIHNEHQRELHGLLGLVQEIQYMFETDPEAASVIDPWIATQFADVALVAEIINAVDALAPWFDELKAVLIADRHAVLKKVNKTRNLVNKLKLGIRLATADPKHLKFDPHDRDMVDYPAEKRPSKAKIDQMRVAEKNLDKFWQSMEKAVSNTQGISLTKVLDCRLKAPRTVYRTEPWTEDLQAHSSTSSSPGSPIVEAAAKHGVLLELDSNVHRPSYREMPIPKKDLLKTPVKTKVKTHGKPAAPDPRRAIPLHNPPEMAPEEVAPPEKIGIPKRAFKVFTALLPSPAAAQQQRPELPWDDLLFAFNAIGLQPVKLYGSVWMFRPVQKGEIAETDAGIRTVGKLNLSRSFQLHEPKEVRRGAKIPKAMVRTFGRRLKHAYGWEVAEDMFACD